MRKFLFWPIRESLCSRNAKISRIFRLAKVSAPKVNMEEKLPADRIVEMHSTIINSTHKTEPKGHIPLLTQTDVLF